MKLELSYETTKTMFETNRLKAADVMDGQQVIFFIGGALYSGTVVRCSGCPNISTINAGRVDAAKTPESELLKVMFVCSKRMLEPDAIGCYNADGSGDVLCPDCAAGRGDIVGLGV
jgi:hypothetical protein